MTRIMVGRKLGIGPEALRYAESCGLLPAITEVGSQSYLSAARLFVAARKRGLSVKDLVSTIRDSAPSGVLEVGHA